MKRFLVSVFASIGFIGAIALALLLNFILSGCSLPCEQSDNCLSGDVCSEGVCVTAPQNPTYVGPDRNRENAIDVPGEGEDDTPIDTPDDTPNDTPNDTNDTPTMGGEEEESDLPVAECPASCNAGCLPGGECIIACDDERSCEEEDLVCPAGRDCFVLCEGERSCEEANLLCDENSRCELTCSGERSCEDLRLECEGDCLATCSGERSCEDIRLRCEGDQCDATCPEGLERPAEICEQ